MMHYIIVFFKVLQVPPVTSSVLQQVSTMDCNNVHDQLSLLSSISNFHWWQCIRCDGKKSSSDICVNLTDHFLYHPSCEQTDTFKLKYIPKFPRNKLMYYQTYEAEQSCYFS